MLFSVIVPIYKIEKYLCRCIDSVLAQSFSDYELILVDDGSPDQCPAICDEYAQKDARIRVIHKENGGLVSARQAGIQIAVGDYVFHLDGDDAICEDALEHAYQIICKMHPDIVSFSYRRCINGELGDVVDDLVPEGLYRKSDMEEKIFPRLLSDENMMHLFYFLCVKAIKRELAVKHQMNVNRAISLGEDLSCSIPCYLEADTVYMSRKVVYLYTIRNDSLTTDFKTSQITQIADVIIGLRALEMKKPQDFEAQIARYSFFMCFAILASAAEGGHFKSLDELRRLILNSLHKEEIQKAAFTDITVKTRISVFLMKRNMIRATFYFLFLCKQIKSLKKGRRS
jgi:glycosyltransferase involved in cell wall biosynthesis